MTPCMYEFQRGSKKPNQNKRNKWRNGREMKYESDGLKVRPVPKDFTYMPLFIV